MIGGSQLPEEPTGQKPVLLDMLLIPLAVCLFSLSPILIRICEQEITPNAVVFNRFWMAAVGVGLWEGIGNRGLNRPSEQQKSLTAGDIGVFLLAAGFGAGNMTAWSWSLTQTNIASSNLLHNMTPFFATIGGWLFLRQSFDGKFLLGLSLALVGVIAIGIEDFQLSADHFTGDGLALLSSIFYAAKTLCVEKLRVKFSATTIIFWSCLLRSLSLLPVVLLLDEKIFPTSVNGWLALFYLVLFCQILAVTIISHSLKQFSSGFVTLFLLFDPIIAAILAWFIFAEKTSVTTGLSFVVVLIGVYLAKSGRGSQKTIEKSIDNLAKPT